MRLNVFNSLMGLCVATAAVSCSDGLVEDNLRPVGGESDMISFVVANENNATRGGSLGNRPCGGAILRSANGADSLYLNMEVSDIADDLNTRAEDISSTTPPSKLFMTCRRRDESNPNFNYYFENTLFEKKGDTWKSEDPFYWLGFVTTWFRFFGYYAENKDDVVFIQGTYDNDFVPSINYTIPTDTKNQFDLSYYESPELEILSNQNSAVSVSMKHALSRIAIKTGTLPEGTEITGVKITNLYNEGNLDLGNGKWTPKGDPIDKELKEGTAYMVLPTNENNLNIPSGQEYNPYAQNSFLVVTVKTSKGEKPYSAPLENVTWEAGKQYSYTINIKPDDPEISIELTDGYRLINDEYMVDAHYVIAKAKVNVLEGAKSKNWTLGASATDKDGNEVDVTFVRAANNTYKDFISYYDQGYWLDTYTKGNKVTSARGTSTETVSADDEVYIFIPENASANADIRVININLINKDGSTQLLKSIKQLPPAWNESGLGVERFEDGDYPWGFSWDSNATITYQKKGTSSGILGFAEGVIYSYQAWLFENRVKHPSYVTSHYEWPTWTVTINCSGITKPTTADDEINGKSNTWNILNFTGIDELDNAIAQLVSWRLKPIDENEIDNPLDFAARACAMKNKYNIEYSGSNGDQNSYDLKFNENDLVWYLPAVNEAANMKDEKFNLDGNYWTSTAIIDPGTTAYQFTYGGSSSGEKRSYKLHVRACRQRN